ncbi:MAG: hypothetical protein HON70_23470, partial [Lentisphaerae bacterium]|nr:hypothetical protein [Lentisphaerota bacterium]
AKAQIQAIGPELVLVGGDITRDGNVHRFELEEMRSELDDLGCPYYPVPGNMDTGNKHTAVEGCHRRNDNQCSDIELNVTSGQLQHFSQVFGPLWWSVDHRNVRFSGVADVMINSGLPEEEQFWEWAELQARRAPADQHVWIMHNALFAESPDEPNWDITDPVNYRNWYFGTDQPGRDRLLDLFKRTNATIVISGHIHCRRTVMAEGIRFDYAPATAFGQWGDRWPDGDASLGFLLYTVHSDRVDCEFVPLETVSQRKDVYGVGGHPCPAARDYSEAWDQSFARELGGRVPSQADLP